MEGNLAHIHATEHELRIGELKQHSHQNQRGLRESCAHTEKVKDELSKPGKKEGDILYDKAVSTRQMSGTILLPGK